ncbi:MAG: glycosyltransferase [Phascolarctobacterium sp.]|uniref:glycosyltransferase n=1 Tax=Phascolarctobacterium sp. TaxID=2049039 RepID=UPI0026DAA70D|nr:glycosyltransferase [Phascolarctobacterium sp.]MDO4922072.1 glycosyltransferase [Phascolarctobacterium sp.]
MIRVLHILQTLNVCGGIENFVMNYYRHIDKKKIQFDFLIHELSDDNFVDEVESLGGRVYLMPKFTISNLSKIMNKLQSFYNEHKEYDIIHCHMANAAPFHFYFARNGEIRILHSHQPSGADRLIHRIRNYFLLKMANAMTNVRFAGSQDSGFFLFGSYPFTIIKNAVEADIFKNSVVFRDSTRRRLGLNDRFVLGHVGRFAPVKNHVFLLDIIQKLIILRPKAVLCLVGEGEKKKAIINEIAKRGLQDNVIMLDTCKNVEELYSSFDVFLLPSFYEGFGLVAVEAQYAGIHVIASKNRVPVESKISNYLEFLPLENGADAWVQKIIEICENKESIVFEREDYDIRIQAKSLENMYLELYSKNEKN